MTVYYLKYTELCLDCVKLQIHVRLCVELFYLVICIECLNVFSIDGVDYAFDHGNTWFGHHFDFVRIRKYFISTYDRSNYQMHILHSFTFSSVGQSSPGTNPQPVKLFFASPIICEKVVRWIYTNILFTSRSSKRINAIFTKSHTYYQ